MHFNIGRNIKLKRTHSDINKYSIKYYREKEMKKNIKTRIRKGQESSLDHVISLNFAIEKAVKKSMNRVRKDHIKIINHG